MRWIEDVAAISSKPSKELTDVRRRYKIDAAVKQVGNSTIAGRAQLSDLRPPPEVFLR